MVEDQIPQYADLLKQLFLFQGLKEAQVAHIVTRFEPVSYDGDRQVFAQGMEGDKFFIVFKGQVQVTRQERQGERFLGILGSGEYFGEEALLYNRPRSATVKTLEPTVLLSLERERFQNMIQEFPLISRILSTTAESRNLAQAQNFDWLGDDEVIHIVRRKHELFLIAALLLPIFIGLISIPILAYGVTDYTASSWHKTATIIGFVGIVLSILWLIWSWVDWGNDFYVVTNQRVLRLEKVVMLYNSRREAPLTQILSVNVAKTYFGRLLKYGDVEVRTFTGGIRMPRASNPDWFAAYVEGFKARAGYLAKQEENESIRRWLREHMGLPAEANGSGPVTSVRHTRRNVPKPGSFRDFLNTLFVVRYEEENVITYRKHWLLLVRKVWIPSILMLLLVVFVGYQVNDYISGSTQFFASPLMFTLYALAYLGLFAWWVYGYLDWSNDIYQLAPEQIRDIERKPLGEEIKKTAPLESILSLEHARDGIIQLAFNFGNVIINVGETRFIFRGVYNPDQVHQDVSDYIEALRRKKREVELARDRERMLIWLLAYKDQVELLEIIESEEDWDIFPG